MQSLFDESPQPEAQVRCIECSHFEGSKRDRGAFLFRRRSGYCEIDDRPGGRWNVLQNIDPPRRCAHYLRAPESLIKQRTTYLARLTNPGGESIQDRAQRLWHR